MKCLHKQPQRHYIEIDDSSLLFLLLFVSPQLVNRIRNLFIICLSCFILALGFRISSMSENKFFIFILLLSALILILQGLYLLSGDKFSLSFTYHLSINFPWFMFLGYYNSCFSWTNCSQGRGSLSVVEFLYLKVG